MFKKFLASALAVLTIVSGMQILAFANEAIVNNDGFENCSVNMTKLGSYISGHSNKDGGVAEIVSYDSKNNNAWVVNGTTGMLDIIDLKNVTCGLSAELTEKSLDIKAIVEKAVTDFEYGDMTSVSVNSELRLVAVALQESAYDKDGKIALFDTEGNLISIFNAGNQPDMVTFTPDGTKILSANEGEPREGYGENVTDPKGSVTVITLDKNNLKNSVSKTVTFDSFDEKRSELVGQGIIFTKNVAPSVDFEPEYIATNDKTAYIALQEANAIAALNLETLEFTGVYSLGYKDLSLEENAIDLLEDNEYNPKTYENAVGAYMPDGISLYTLGENNYILTSNEGDAREWGTGDNEFVNEVKEKLTATDGETAKSVRVLDKEVTEGLPESKSVLFGGRSFSIYEVKDNGLTQVYDSDNDFEVKTAEYFPEYFNCSNDDNDYDSRSRKKGPEPESVTIGTVGNKTFAFVGLERIGGIMAYDITDIENISFKNYINTRDFSENPEDVDPESENYLKSDIAPEGMYFVSADNSPSSTPILLAAFEVSGTVAAYSVGATPNKGHTIVTDEAVAPTCTKTGLTEGKHCSVCGEVIVEQKVVAKTAHKITVINQKNATYANEGNTGDKICTVCNTILEKGKTVAIKKLSAPAVTLRTKAKKITIKYNKVVGAKKYEVQIKINGKWKKLNTSKTIYVLKKLAKGKNYKVRVRAYTTLKGLKYYSKFSKIQTIKVK